MLPIREATVADVALCAALRLEFMTELGLVVPTDDQAALAARLEAFFATGLADGSVRAWLAEAGGRVVSHAMSVAHRMPPRPGSSEWQAYIFDVHTAPDARRRGLSRAVLERCFTDLADAGIIDVRLIATDDGRPLYETFGLALKTNAMEGRLPEPGTGGSPHAR